MFPRRVLLALIPVTILAVGSVWWFAAQRRETAQSGFTRNAHLSERNDGSQRISEKRISPIDQEDVSPGVDERLMSLDPRQDGWESEYLHERVKAQLERFGELIASHDANAEAMAAHFLAEPFRCSELRPGRLETVYEVSPLRVLRPTPEQLAASQGRSTDSLVEALRNLQEPLRRAEDVHCKFKVFGITAESDRVTTVQYVEISGRDSQSMVEQSATWEIDWRRVSVDDMLKIRSIKLLDFEEIQSTNDGASLFADYTASLFWDEKAIFAQQYGTGIGRWVGRLETYLKVYQFGHNGLAIGDVNGDGLEDIYSCQVGGLPNRLFVQQADGTLRDRSSEAGVDFLDNTRSALLLDLDNDYDQDLIVALADRLSILENDGGVRFQVRFEMRSAPHLFSLAAADYDHDGDLDVYACGYYGDKDMAARLPIPLPMYDANNGGRNYLLRNDGQWRFADVTASVGLDVNNTRFSFAAVWEDYDNDGDQDLFVANDFGSNNLYRNDQGQFRDVTQAVGMQDGAFGMSAASADYNHDGWFDFYKANMFSSAGNRVTNQPQFMPNATAEHRDRFRHLARGNALFENHGGTFREVSSERGVVMGRWGWGAVFLDVNNDSWEDLFAANGFMTGDRPDDL